MKRNHFLQLIIFCLMIFGALPLRAAPIDPTEAKTWANSQGQLLLGTFGETNVAKKYQKLDEIFLNYVDLDYIGRFVVGKYWKDLTPAQKEQYIPLFKRYSLAIYKGFPLDFGGKITFQVNRVDTQENYSDVMTGIATGGIDANGQPTQFLVVFRLVRAGNGLKIVDIKLAESSLILSYRNRFYQMISDNDGDMGWFLEDLENITTSTEKSNKMRLDNAI